jgi:hypothetical protein
MIWILVVTGAVVVGATVVAIRLVRSRRREEDLNARMYGRCPQCSRAPGTRRRTETVTRMLGGGRGLQRTVEVIDAYCPKCNTVIRSDVFGEVERARQEMQNMC